MEKKPRRKSFYGKENQKGKQLCGFNPIKEGGTLVSYGNQFKGGGMLLSKSSQISGRQHFTAVRHPLFHHTAQNADSPEPRDTCAPACSYVRFYSWWWKCWFWLPSVTDSGYHMLVSRRPLYHHHVPLCPTSSPSPEYCSPWLPICPPACPRGSLGVHQPWSLAQHTWPHL